MPLLKAGSRPMQVRGADEIAFSDPLRAGADGGRGSTLIRHCSNPECRSGWIQLFRSRRGPFFEGGWTCSPDCTEALLRIAVHRELDGWVQSAEAYRHRIPLGLLMLEQGWISGRQLRTALEAQRKAGELRIGEWLVRQGATSEAMVCRALSVQWGCPVLPLESGGGLMTSQDLLPRLFVEAFGALPVKDPTGTFLYLGFEQSVDTALTFAAERMARQRVESGIVPSYAYFELTRRLTSTEFPEVQVAEAASDSAAAHLLAKSIERAQPISSRLVRVHDWLWLRMQTRPRSSPLASNECMFDVVCRLGAIG